MNLNGRSFLFSALLLTGLLPYVDFDLLNVDVTPFFSVLCILTILVTNNFRLTDWLIVFIGTLYTALITIYSALSGDFFSGSTIARLYFTYLFLVGLLTVGRNLLSGKLVTPMLLPVLTLYIAAALLQTFNISTLEILSEARGAGGRGVSSLASEPTFFALIMLIIILIHYIESKTTVVLFDWRIVGMAILGVVLSRSSTALLFIFVFLIFGLNRRLLRWLFVIPIAGLVILVIVPDFILSSRPFKLAIQVLEGGLIVAMQDGSVNERVSAVIFPYTGSFSNFGLPNGFVAYEEYSQQMRDQSALFFWGSGGKIMNLIGSAVFELGLPLLFINIYLISRLYVRRILGLRHSALLFVLLNTSISAASGYIIIFYGILYKLIFTRGEELSRLQSSR